MRSNKFLLGALLLLLCASCSNESEPHASTPDPDEGREQSVVDINLSFGEVWNFDDETRAAPPSSNPVDNDKSYEEIEGIETVRVYTFRRKEGSDGEFYFDKNNSKDLPVEKKQQGEHKHSIAKGKLTKTYGYEYRVIAIAYPTKTDSEFYNITSLKFPTDNDFFMSITTDTYSGFCAKLTTVACGDWSDYLKGASINNTKHINEQILHTPQLFYGTLHTEYTDSDIIQYAEEDKEGNMDAAVSLTGILKRGVAKVEVIFPANTFKSGTQWITVLAETPNTKVGLKGYDDFLKPTEPLNITYRGDWSISEGKYIYEHKYTAVGHVNIGGSSGEQFQQKVTFYILACTTKLAIRVKTLETVWPITYTHLENGQLTGDGVEMHGDNGTGIVSPDLIDDVFYFRRNHKYTITVNSAKNVLDKHKLD